MKKQIVFLLAIVVFIIPQYTLAESKMEKADKLITVGENYAASQLIHQAILDNPANPAVHYRAADLYIKIPMMKEYYKALNNSCKLDKSYCPKVAKRYYNIARNALNGKIKTSSVTNSYRRAFSFEPKRKQASLDKIFLHGKKTLEAGDIYESDSSFVVLRNLSPNYNERVAKLYLEISPKVLADATVFLLERAIDFDPSCKSEVGNISAKMAMNKKYSKNERRNFKELARKYLERTSFLEYFPPPPPNYINLKLGVLYVTKPLKKGELSEFWIGGPGFPAKRSYGRRGDKHIAVVLDNGKEYAITKGESPPKNGQYRFKFKGLEDGAIGIARYDPL